MANKYVLNSLAILAATALVSGTAHAGGDYNKTDKETQQSTEGMHSSDSMSPEVESQQEMGTAGEMDSTGQDVTSPEAEGTVTSPSEPSVATTPDASSVDSTTANLSRDEIRRVQESLNTSAGTDLAADGVLGPQTREALRKYQEEQGIQVTGSIDQETMSSLGINAATDSTRRPASVTPATPETPSEPSLNTEEEMNPTPGSEINNDMEMEQSTPEMDDNIEQDIETEQSAPMNNDSSVNSEDLNQEVQ